MALLLSSSAIRSLLGKLTGVAAASIAGATNASPSVINVTAHGFAAGDVLVQYNTTGNTAINGLFAVAAVSDADHYTINDLVTGAAVNGNGVTAGSGKAQRVTIGLTPGDIGDLETTLSRINAKKGSDANRSGESTIQTLFSL